MLFKSHVQPAQDSLLQPVILTSFIQPPTYDTIRRTFSGFSVYLSGRQMVLWSFNYFHGLMLTSFVALASATIIFLLSLQPSWAESNFPKQTTDSSDIDLPTFIDEDIFDDLPFEQRRQALREEVELGSKKRKTFSDPKKYNLLIR